jgi:hypothetical protein
MDQEAVEYSWAWEVWRIHNDIEIFSFWEGLQA